MTRISKEYAEALFGLAAESGQTEQIYLALETMRKVFEENPDYGKMLSSPAIPLSERTAAVEEAFSGKVPEYAEFFLKLLCRHGIADRFCGCVGDYRALYLESKGVSRAEVISAVELTDVQKQSVEKKLTALCGRKVITEYTVDPSYIGGLSVSVDGKIMDGSVKRRLREIKEVIDR